MLNLVSIEKIPQPYTARITFNILPFTDLLKKSNPFDQVDLISASCTKKAVQIVDQQLIVTFTYSQTIDHQYA
jgi:hypothetical protein